MVRANSSVVEADTRRTTEFLTCYYAMMETNEPARYGSFYADDVRLRFGNDDVIVGREATVKAFDNVLGRVSRLHHDLVNVWLQPGGVVIFESVGTWYLYSGVSVSIPACSVFTIEEGLFTNLRIYVDNAPVLAALEEEGK